MRTLRWNCDTLPFLRSILDAIEGDDWFSLEDVVEHWSGVVVVWLSLSWSQRDQSRPRVTEVTAIPPGQLVLIILHFQTQVVPSYPLFTGIICVKKSFQIGS